MINRQRIDDLKRELAELRSKLPSKKEGLCGRHLGNDPITIVQRMEELEEELSKLERGE